MPETRAPSVAQIFDSVVGVYDQSGVPFFTPVGERLVGLLEPRPGERCLDIGCGRGAVTLPLARAVGPTGSVDAVDVSPAMVEATRSLAEEAGLGQVHAEVGDAADLSGYEPGSYDVVGSSLVIFFLSELGSRCAAGSSGSPPAGGSGWARSA